MKNIIPVIELEGQEYPVAFPTSALAEFERMSGLSTFHFLEALDAGQVAFKDLCRLLASGLNAGARKTGSEARYTPEQAGDIFGVYDVPKLTPILAQYLTIKKRDDDSEKNDMGAALTTEIPEA